MRPLTVSRRKVTAAPPAVVFALLREQASWPQWSPVDEVRFARPGRHDRDDVGAVRLFRTGRRTMHEEVVELVPERRVAYVLHRGLALRGYRADVDLAPAGDGTVITWAATFRAKVPGTGWLYRRALGDAYERFLAGLAERAERDAERAPSGRTTVPDPAVPPVGR